MGYLTRQQLREKVFERFGESAGFITDNNVNNWLAESYVIFATGAQCLVGYQKMPVTDSVVILPGGVKEVLAVDIGDADATINFEKGTNCIILRPSTNTPAVVNVKYIAVPSEDPKAIFKQLAADTDKTALSEQGDRGLIAGALARAYKKDNREQRWQTAEQEFLSIVQTEFVSTEDLRRRPTLRTSAWTGSTFRGIPEGGVSGW